MKEVRASLSTDKNILKKQEASVVTPRLVSAFKSRNERSPVKSKRRMVRDLNFSEATVRRVVKKNIADRLVAKTKIFFLLTV